MSAGLPAILTAMAGIKVESRNPGERWTLLPSRYVSRPYVPNPYPLFPALILLISSIRCASNFSRPSCVGW